VAVIHGLYVLQIETVIITRAKSGSALSRVGAKKGIQPTNVNKAAI